MQRHDWETDHALLIVELHVMFIDSFWYVLRICSWGIFAFKAKSNHKTCNGLYWYFLMTKIPKSYFWWSIKDWTMHHVLGQFWTVFKVAISCCIVNSWYQNVFHPNVWVNWKLAGIMLSFIIKSLSIMVTMAML